MIPYLLAFILTGAYLRILASEECRQSVSQLRSITHIIRMIWMRCDVWVKQAKVNDDSFGTAPGWYISPKIWINN